VAKKPRSRNHGLSRTLGYGVWVAMKVRCSNPTDKNYKHYGARGIKVCPRWAEDYENFLADMGECPKGMTLDRIDNDGDYEPTNCRWTTMSNQVINKRYRKRLADSSPYRGVYRRTKDNWAATITLDKRKQHIGTYDDDLEAAIMWDAAAIQLHGKDAKLNVLEYA
jgi:hypothetical protein